MSWLAVRVRVIVSDEGGGERWYSYGSLGRWLSSVLM